MKIFSKKKSNPGAFRFAGAPDSIKPAWKNPLLEILLYALVCFLIVVGSVMSLSSGYRLLLDTEMVLGCVLGMSLLLSALYRSPVGGWVFPGGLLLVGWIGLRNWEELWAELTVFWNRALELLEPYLITQLALEPQTPKTESGTPLVLLLLFFLCLWVGFFSARLPRLFPVFLLTFALMELVFWTGLAPNLIFMTMALTGYGLVLALSQTAGSDRFHLTGYRKKRDGKPAKKIRSRPLPRVLGPAMLTVLVLFLCSVLAAQTYLSSSDYKRPESLDRIRNTALTTDWSSILYFPDLFRGNLSAAGQQSFDHKTDLFVTAPHQYNTLYLKGFTGARYENGVWKSLPDSAYRQEPFPSLESDATTYERESAEAFTLYRQHSEEMGSYLSEEAKASRSVTVDPVRTGRKYAYLPYSARPADNLHYNYDRFASLGSGPRYSADFFYDSVFTQGIFNYIDGKMTSSLGTSQGYYTYAPGQNYDITINNDAPSGSEIIIGGTATNEFNEWDYSEEPFEENPYELSYRDFVLDQYLEIPKGFEKMLGDFDSQLKDVLFQEEYGPSSYGLYALTEALRSFLRERTEYSLSPGGVPAGMDPLNYFLYENHKGYCMHFASVSTLLLRHLGIPARYVEGYVVAEKDFTLGEETTGADGNPALLMPIRDSNAHAWAEIYLDGYGWFPIETTPGYAFQLDELPTIEQEQRERAEAQRLAASAAAASSRAASSSGSSSGSSSSSGGSSSSASPSSAAETDEKGGIFPLILLLLLLTAAVISLPFLSRRTVLYFRRRSTGTNNVNVNMLNLYAFLVVLLKSEKFPKAEYVCYHPDRLAEAYAFLTPEQCEEGMETVLRARFSGQKVTRKEQKQLAALIHRLQTRIYASKKLPGRLWMKYVRAMI